jgi:hypothetical protein
LAIGYWEVPPHAALYLLLPQGLHQAHTAEKDDRCFAWMRKNQAEVHHDFLLLKETLAEMPL